MRGFMADLISPMIAVRRPESEDIWHFLKPDGKMTHCRQVLMCECLQEKVSNLNPSQFCPICLGPLIAQ
jgi:hypothetical protein